MKVVGGQAVIEGVMMRSGNKIATAIRKQGKIKVKKETLTMWGERYPILKIPFVRGFVNLLELMIVGIRTLEYSAQEAVGENEKISKGALTLTVAFAIAAGIFLFVLLPYFLTYVMGLKEQNQPFLFNLTDGIVKLIVLVAYIYAIGFLNDVKVLFQYHGAEHKAIAAYEHGKAVDVKNAKKYATAHARCGTSFLLFVILVGVILFSFVPLIVFRLFPYVLTMHWLAKYTILFLARLVTLPIIAGVAYELLRLSAKIDENSVLRMVLWPGLAVQKLTTREPTSKQLEVAVAALKAVL
jgi:uncharacterized protein YqhQ